MRSAFRKRDTFFSTELEKEMTQGLFVNADEFLEDTKFTGG